MNGRGLTPVLGIVLLLGLTTVVAMSLLLVSATMIGNSQTDAETRQAEQSLSQFAQTTEQIAEGEVGEASYELGQGQEADVAVDGDAGFYEVTIERPNGTEVLTNGSLGSYEYEGADGTTLAFQGGGVWRANAGGEDSIVRPPKFHYRASGDPTLTLPVVRLEDRGNRTASGSGEVVVADRRDVYPAKSSHSNPLHEGVVYLDVQSEYCTGWEQFFRSRTDGAVVEDCSANGNDETSEGELLVELSVPFHFDGLNDETAIAERFSGKGTVEGSSSTDVERMQSVSGVVEQRVADCDDGEGERLHYWEVGSGLYCAGSMNGDYVIEPNGGDVEIAVDGPVNPRDISIVGAGTVTIFANGSALKMPPKELGDSSSPEQLRIMVHSDYDVGEIPGSGSKNGNGGKGGKGGGPGAGNMDLYGLIYAPNSDVGFNGNPTIVGGVVAHRLHLNNPPGVVKPDDAVSEIELEFDRGGEPFYYLHVSENTVRLAG